MSGWGGGYITDIAYMPGYYRQQAPQYLSLACLLNGVVGLDPAADEPVSYLELGCGLGFGAMALAASNPHWRVTGIDFNPGHVAAARALAREAGLANVRFLEADLATLAEDPLGESIGEADVVSLHGVWSWVPDAVRRGIVRLLRATVRPGGIVHVSYNSLPAWQGGTGLQRLLREAGRRLATRSDRQAQAGLELARSLSEAGASHLQNNPFVKAMLERLGQVPVAYLAHEYMNEAWSPCFHADVVADLAEARLDWVGSAVLPENFAQLMLTEAQRPLLERFDDPMMRELVKDMCLDRGLRHDVFVRGARRIDNAERAAALGHVTLALARLPENFQYEAVMPAGTAAMEPAFYGPIVAALGEGPRRVRDLLAMPDVVGRRDNPAEMIGMLIGTDQVIPVLPRSRAADGAAARFNRVAARRLLRTDMLNVGVALANGAMATPVPIQMLDLFVHGQLEGGAEPDPEAWTLELSAGRDDAERAPLRAFLDRILAERVPVWRRLGVL